MLVQEGESLHVCKLVTHVSAECRIQGEVRVPTRQAFLTCVDGVGVILVAGKLDALAVDEPYELRSKAVEVAYEEVRLEAGGKAMRKAAVNGDDEVVGFDEGSRGCGRCRSCSLAFVDELAQFATGGFDVVSGDNR